MADDTQPANPIWHTLPAPLRALGEMKAFHLWRLEERVRRHDGVVLMAKVPKDLQGHTRRSNSARGLATWAEAAAALRGLMEGPWKGAVCGIGIATAFMGDASVVDLDACLGEDGQVLAWADPIVDRAERAGAYVERSPSRRGLHIIGNGIMAEAKSCKVVWHPGVEAQPGGKRPAAEVFHGSNHYVTLTGDWFSPSDEDPDALAADLGPLIDQLVREAGAQHGSRLQRAQGWQEGGGTALAGLPCLISEEGLERLLAAVPCGPEVMGDHDEAVAVYCRLAFVIGERWQEMRPTLVEWGLEYDGDETWLEDLLDRIEAHGVRVGHADALLAWVKRVAPDDVAVAMAREINEARVALDYAGVAAEGQGGGEAGSGGPEAVEEAGINPVATTMQREAARAVAAALSGRLRYLVERDMWVTCFEGRWRQGMDADAHSLIAREIDKHAALHGKTVSMQRKLLSWEWYRGVLNMLRQEKSIAMSYATWDADPWLLATPDGVVDLRKGTMRPARPDDYMLLATEVSPAPEGAQAPLFLRFLGIAFRGDQDMLRYVQQLFGLALVGQSVEQFLMILYGSGGTGKSTLARVMMSVLGDYASVVPSTVLLKGTSHVHPEVMMPLKGRRLCVINELPPRATFDVEKLKMLTGGDEISARDIREKRTTWKATHTLMLVCNGLPDAEGDDAVRRRMQVVPMNTPPEKPDSGLFDYLQHERPQILRWALDGLQDYLQCGQGVAVPEQVREAVEEYMSVADPLGHWASVELKFTGSPDDAVMSSVLLARFKAITAARQINLRGVSDTHWHRRLALLLGRDKRATYTGTLRVAGVRGRGWRGVRLECGEWGASDEDTMD